MTTRLGLESCQSAMLLDVPFDDETRPGALEGTLGVGQMQVKRPLGPFFVPGV